MSDIVFQPYPKQEKFIEAAFSGEYNFLTYGGAMGGGKTFVTLATLILLHKIYPGSISCVIRESLPTIKRTTLQSFKKVLPQSFLHSFNQTDHIATFINGSKMIFMAEDYAADKDFDRFKGLEVNFFLLEQIEELQKGLLDICFIRAGRHKIPSNPPPLIFATVNPTLTWAKEHIYQKHVNDTLPKAWYYLPATIYDNMALSEDKAYLAQFDNLDPLTYARHIEGSWDAFAVDKPFFYCFDEKKHINASITFNPRLPVILSFDFNVDPCTCVISQVDTNFIHVLDEVRLSNSGTEAVCEAIKTKDWYNANLWLIVTGDASGLHKDTRSGGGVNDYTIIMKSLGLSQKQIKLPGKNPPISESKTLCNSILSRHPNTFVHPRCKYLIEDMRFVQVKDDGSIDKTSDAHKGHLLDGLRYCLSAFKGDFIIKGK